MFFESILFLQKLKISKTVLPCFSDSVAGQTSCMSQSRSRGSVLATCSRVEGPITRGTQKFSRLSSQLPREWDFQSRKTLSKFFSKLLTWSVLAGETGDFLATYLSREKRVFCTVKAVFKTFSVFPRTFYDYSLSLSIETNPSTPCHPLQTPFLHHLNSKSSRKRYGFSLSHLIFLFWAFPFWFYELIFWFAMGWWFGVEFCPCMACWGSWFMWTCLGC